MHQEMLLPHSFAPDVLKNVILAYWKTLVLHLPNWTDENHEKLQSRQPASAQIIKSLAS
jgi:hypothetical protein